MEYKLRAECSNDVLLFVALCGTKLTNFSMKEWEGYPDVDFVFTTDLSITEIINLMKTIDDSHVMIETVRPINEYTGIRDYSTTN